ncbi:MAG: hypothetical protein HY243_18855 [Proteobacteria bacterium]|nr:hypothetical protein [Pseudomonadota bacterium]
MNLITLESVMADRPDPGLDPGVGVSAIHDLDANTFAPRHLPWVFMDGRDALHCVTRRPAMTSSFYSIKIEAGLEKAH